MVRTPLIPALGLTRAERTTASRRKAGKGGQRVETGDVWKKRKEQERTRRGGHQGQPPSYTASRGVKGKVRCTEEEKDAQREKVDRII